MIAEVTDHPKRISYWKDLSESRGFSLIPLKGKVPKEKSWQQWCEKRREFKADDFGPGLNAGIACGSASGVIVLDVDDVDVFDRIAKEESWDLPETFTVRSGRGGLHYYYLHPRDGKGYKNASKKSQGFDVKADAGVIVAPGSIHPVTGKPYSVELDLPIAPAPRWLLELIRQTVFDIYSGKASTSFESYIDVREDVVLSLHVSEHIKNLILQGVPKGERSQAMMKVLNALADISLSDDAIFALFERHPIGEKALEKGSYWKEWLEPQIQKARERIAMVKTVTEWNLTDWGNAERLVALHGDHIRFCAESQSWYNFSGQRWEPDKTNELKRRAIATVRSMSVDAKRLDNEEKRRALMKHAEKSESKSKLANMVELAAAQEGITILQNQFDCHPWLFNVQNGTLDLKTIRLLPHDKGHFITKLSSVPFDPRAKCPTWDGFIACCMEGNKRSINYLKRVVGYSLTGDTREQRLFHIHGNGANGKSTFLEILKRLMGDYAMTTDFNTFVSKAGESVRNDLARLRGARLITTTETGAGRSLDERVIKQWTGFDTISARFLFKEFEEFKPEGKIFIAGNNKLEIQGSDEGIWRRIDYIPFGRTIPFAERDPKLFEKLHSESSGILNWCLEGCTDWQENGLVPPPEIVEATASYREEMDALGGFVTECCKSHDLVKVSMHELYMVYVEWCRDNMQPVLSKKAFGSKLDEKGIKSKRGTGGKWLRLGIALKDEVRSKYICEDPTALSVTRRAA